MHKHWDPLLWCRFCVLCWISPCVVHVIRLDYWDILLLRQYCCPLQKQNRAVVRNTLIRHQILSIVVGSQVLLFAHILMFTIFRSRPYFEMKAKFNQVMEVSCWAALIHWSFFLYCVDADRDCDISEPFFSCLNFISWGIVCIHTASYSNAVIKNFQWSRTPVFHFSVSDSYLWLSLFISLFHVFICTKIIFGCCGKEFPII